MKVLLVGPFPPPHGGVSVHVAALRRELEDAGVVVRVVNLDPRAPRRDGCLSIRGGFDLIQVIRRHVREGYVVHLHTSGHNDKGWMIAFACGAAAYGSPRALLTIHSGMMPGYVEEAGFARRRLAAAALRLYTHVVCVNARVKSAAVRLGVPTARLRVIPAFIPPRPSLRELPGELAAWMAERRPLLVTAVFHRPEYGLDVLLGAVARMHVKTPRLGLLVLGSGDATAAHAAVESHGLSSAVRLLGDQDHEDCLAILKRADVFVRPTRADGDSISVREALALGVPTVASDVVARPEGTHVFATGDAVALAEVLGSVLQTGARPGPPSEAPFTGRLLELYGEPQRGVPATGASHARAIIRG